MKALNKLTDLGISLDDLYLGKKQINIKLTDKDYMFNVVLVTGFVTKYIDCNISSWQANMFFRTPKGIKYEKYKTLGILQNAIVKAVYKNVETKGNIEFTLNDEVFTI